MNEKFSTPAEMFTKFRQVIVSRRMLTGGTFRGVTRQILAGDIPDFRNLAGSPDFRPDTPGCQLFPESSPGASFLVWVADFPESGRIPRFPVWTPSGCQISRNLAGRPVSRFRTGKLGPGGSFQAWNPPGKPFPGGGTPPSGGGSAPLNQRLIKPPNWEIR
jgi:hypothetical protein